MRKGAEKSDHGSTVGNRGLETLERRLMLDAWYVSTVTDPLEDGSALHPFDSIQEAIDAGADGDSVNVLFGNYTESLDIGKELTFQGANPTVTGRHVVTASNVTFNDFTFNADVVAIEIDHSAAAGDLTNIGVYDCVFNLDATELGVKIGGNNLSDNAMSNIAIVDSTFNGPAGGNSNPFRIGDSPIGVGNLDVTVTNLDFTGNTVDKGSIPIQLHNKDVSDILIDDNTFTDTEGVVYIWTSLDSPTGVLSDFVFSNNTVDNTGSTDGYGLGFDLYNKYTAANIPDGEITITGNTFTEVGVVDLATWGLSGLFGTVSVLTADVTLDTAAVRANNTFDRVAGVVGGNDLYDEIQTAIDTAVDGDTVLVGDGTYTEDLAVTQADLTLVSESGYGLTTIQLVDGVGIAVQGTADNFTLGGSGAGFEVLSGAGTTFLIELANAPAGVTIAYNDLTPVGNATMGVSIGAAGASGLTIMENSFTTEDGDGAIWGPDVVDVAVTGNVFQVVGGAASGYAIQFSGVTGTSLIDDNYTDDFASAILISNGTGTSGLTISNNQVLNGINGIRFAQYSPGADGDMTTVTVTGNFINNNTTGLLVGDGANVLAGQFTITENSFSGNTTNLDNQHATATVDASANWWGSNVAATVAGAISGSVDYTPWLDAATDTSGDAGFQGDFSTLNVDDGGQQVGATGRIQEGINLVTASTVKIWPGNYTEDIALNKSVTLQPGDNAAVSITGRHVMTANDVSIIGEFSGDTQEWITLVASGNVAVEIDQAGGPISGLTIEHVIFDLGTDGDIGVKIGGNAASDNAITDLSITANQFYGPASMIANPIRIGGYFGGGHLQVPVSNLIFAGNQVDSASLPVQLEDKDLSDLLFTGNTFTNTDGGLYLWTQDDTPTGVLSDFEFSDNDLSGNNSYGVGFDVFDKYTDANFGSNITINYNNFANIAGAYGFGGVGILSSGLTSFELDAQKNWWGDAKGPDHATNPHVAGGGSTTGSAVSDNVDFTPWYATVTTDPASENVTVEHNPIIAVSDTIQGAIDAALAGDTLTASDGTYTEDLTVGKANLTLQSVNGSGSTTIQLITGVGISLDAGAAGFALGGVGAGFTVLSGGATTFLVELANAPADVTIAYNALSTTGSASMGVSVGAAGASGLTINNNAFTAGDLDDGSIWGPDVVDVTVSDNTFAGPAAQAASGYAVQFSGVTGTSTISGNTIDDYANGILISNGTGTSGLSIDDNTVTDSTNGIRFAQYSPGADGDMTTVSITLNDLSGNTTGILIGDGANVLASNFTITGNSIAGNTTGLDNQHTTEAVTAEKNWWGHATGADHATNPHGTGQGGDTVSDNVDFTPWYATSTTTAATENVSVEHNPIIAVSDTIQGAIDAALAGDTLTASDGTYTEDLTVGKANLTLQSVNGSGSTTIQLITGVGISLDAGAAGFTLGGVGAGFTVLSGGATTFLVQLANAPAGVTIAYNALSTTGSASMGVSVGAAGASGLTINNNAFTAGDLGDGSIWGPDVVDVTVSDNTFAGPAAQAASGYAVQFSGVTGASTISGNTIDNYANGILISNGAGTTGLSIDGNTVTDGTNGIRFAEYAPGAAGMLTGVTVTENVVTGNSVGVLVSAGAHLSPNNIQVSGNNLSGNTLPVENQHGDTLDASGNWWGVTDAADVADETDGPVDYTPWLNSGTDTEPGTAGFQGDFSYLHVSADSPQVGATGRIQEAVDLATGSTVNVWDGEYNENITVDKPDVTLQSQNGPDSTMIQPGAGVGIDVLANGDNFALGGSDGHGFDLVSGTGTTFLIQLVNAPSDVTVSDNWIDMTGDASMGVSVGAAGANNLTIAYNLFRTEDVGDGAIWGPSVSNVTVSENTFTGPAPLAASGYAVQFSGVTGTSAIENNFIADWGMGIVISNGPGTTGLLIDGNNISENTNGIRLTQYSPGVNGDMTGVTITNNKVWMNTIGLRVDDGANVLASNFTVNNNDFVANATFGAQNNHATQLLTAENNWWGNDDGPFHATNPGGDGDAVSNNIDFTPWLGAALFAKTDLVVTFYSFGLPDNSVPSDTARVKVTVTNLGDARALGDVVINLYLSPDPWVSADAVLIGTIEPTLRLSSGRSRRYTIRPMVPYNMEPGDYHVIVEVDSDDDFDEIREDNNETQRNSLNVSRRFGNFDTRTNVKMTLLDPLAVPVTFRMRRDGWGQVALDGTNGYFEITLNATNDRTRVYVDTPRGQTTTIDELAAATQVHTFDADTSGLLGLMNFTNANGVSKIVLGDVTTGQLAVNGLLKQLRVASWGAGSVTADVLQRLTSNGNWNADLTINNVGAEEWGLGGATIRGTLGCTWDITGGLRKLRVDDWLTDATIRISGDLWNARLGGIDDSTLFVGVNPAVPAGELPDPATAFVDSAEIHSLRFTGINGEAWRGSYVAAPVIYRASICNVRLDNGGTDHGLSAELVNSLKLNQDGVRYTWPDNWLTNPVDLLVWTA